MNIIIINEEEKPIKKRHIGWTYRVDPSSTMGDLILIEIVECYYKHPEAPENALIQKIELIDIDKIKYIEEKAAPLHLLKNASENISLIYEKVLGEKKWQ